MPGDALSQDPAELRRRIDSSKAHPARVYDVFLGGKDHYPADRDAAAAGLAANPRGYLDVRHNRDFLRRAVTALAGQDGIRQFLDIGTGLPTAENVHQIAQRIAPESRVVYVDNDPVVLAHARALLTSGPEGRTDYIDADLKSPERILELASATLDFSRPVALCLVAILHFVEDEEAYPIVRGLMDALPAGSRLVLSHLTEDLNPENIRAVQRTYTERGFTFVLRSHKDVERFFTEAGLDVAEPGVVPVHHWRPDHAAPVPEQPEESYLASLEDIEKVRYKDINDVTDADINVYGGLGTKG
ncbi:MULTISPECIES: SAM-dependent methyltransferase [Streptomyces]|uniref:SAM-dependent methyltransferase n=3 Tax=Streptomyces rochei group TaxID=2867164 RepID=A0AAX3ZKN8_STRRO|nr:MULTISPECIES: SAM-dependent methyltransferase [Streptomyces]MBD2818228.1 SAM-dependent methyltransferase [Streptomyces parvulus]MDV6288854.1 SAM-dependent methyltransferase [Streptomyces sp. UP1A-1]WDI19834.1 SAM-dependent methyltransferase [Streptomyces enissocaesilis]MBQ0915725.1 SAM-dependent methyltransferase [Streptomyces sp. RM99]MBU8551145.1 SAM-dependent methyltransferase [Streptomyces sp. Osf17]